MILPLNFIVLATLEETPGFFDAEKSIVIKFVDEGARQCVWLCRRYRTNEGAGQFRSAGIEQKCFIPRLQRDRVKRRGNMQKSFRLKAIDDAKRVGRESRMLRLEF